MESKGRVPTRFLLARLICVTKPLELHRIPVKLQGEFDVFHDVKMFGREVCNEDLKFIRD